MDLCVVVFLILLSAFQCKDIRNSVPCSKADNNCYYCVELSHCGFCRGTQKCVDGTTSGPNTGNCSNWHFSNCNYAKCAQPNSCQWCLSESSCGWCDGTHLCEQGSKSGPKKGSCADWKWKNESSCGTPAPPPSPTCDYRDCHQCTAQRHCGWCASTNKCEKGTTQGPQQGSCSKWKFSNCYTPPPPPSPTHSCSKATNCKECVYHSTGCGWCESSHRCESGSSSGPSTGSCSKWDWFGCPSGPPPAPPSPPSCAAGTCRGCLALGNQCGWCQSVHHCEAGNAQGPTKGDCSNWEYYSCHPPPSPPTPMPPTPIPPSPSRCSASNCHDCLAENCGWCSSNSDCESGTASGPSSGTCKNWHWFTCGGPPPPPPVPSPPFPPEPFDPCGAVNCLECLRLGHCGWCASDIKCEAGTRKGPDQGKCRDWKFSRGSCSQPPTPPVPPTPPTPPTPAPPSPPGLPLASTTHYDHSGDPYLDGGQDSACGCNTRRTGAEPLHRWGNAATNDKFFGVDSYQPGPLACGNGKGGCLTCYQLTTTGRRSDSPHFNPKPKKGVVVNVTVADFCPASRNVEWCTSPNKHGYNAHFDLDTSQLPQLDPGTNPEVTYRKIECPDDLQRSWTQNCCSDPKWYCNGTIGGDYACEARPDDFMVRTLGVFP